MLHSGSTLNPLPFIVALFKRYSTRHICVPSLDSPELLINHLYFHIFQLKKRLH